MTPLMIQMLLHYYVSAKDYRDYAPEPHASSSAVNDVIKFFVENDLIIPVCPDDIWAEQSQTERSSQFVVSDRGRAMVEACKAVRLPIIQWVQP